VGTHLPPPAFEVPMQVHDFCLDLEERLHHVADAESIAALRAADGADIGPLKEIWLGRLDD
jgi:hypothetical protein